MKIFMIWEDTQEKRRTVEEKKMNQSLEKKREYVFLKWSGLRT